MAVWGGLNPALTSWREGLNALLPGRGTGSDGGYADAQHGSTSQHQPDADGTVDAFDEDVNLLGSGVDTGTPAERALVDALNLDFEADDRAHLWISRRRIAQHDDSWIERHYGLSNPHDKHTHRQAKQSRERDGRPWAFPHTRALLRALNGDDMDEKSIVAAVLGADEITNLYDDAKTNPKVTVRTALRAALAADVRITRVELATKRIETKLDEILTAVRIGGNG